MEAHSFFADALLVDTSEGGCGLVDWLVLVDIDGRYIKHLELLHAADGPVQMESSGQVLSLL